MLSVSTTMSGMLKNVPDQAGNGTCNHGNSCLMLRQFRYVVRSVRVRDISEMSAVLLIIYGHAQKCAWPGWKWNLQPLKFLPDAPAIQLRCQVGTSKWYFRNECSSFDYIRAGSKMCLTRLEMEPATIEIIAWCSGNSDTLSGRYECVIFQKWVPFFWLYTGMLKNVPHQAGNGTCNHWNYCLMLRQFRYVVRSVRVSDISEMSAVLLIIYIIYYIHRYIVYTISILYIYILYTIYTIYI